MYMSFQNAAAHDVCAAEENDPYSFFFRENKMMSNFFYV